jgi:hypothetical protein
VVDFARIRKLLVRAVKKAQNQELLALLLAALLGKTKHGARKRLGKLRGTVKDVG